ncbi:MAG TPA: hypothetical protein VFX59_12935 [Polyangiales bacterium]|nr:hypothetical protein [Polyangiales bacterium]
MRGSVCVLMLALLGCGDDDNDQPVTDASVRLDGKVSLDAALMERCGNVAACQSGALTQISLCLGSVSAQPTGGLWQVCAIDPQGRAWYLGIRADERITSPGWRYSYYGLVDGTLSDDDTEACVQERSKLIVATADNQPDGGNAICYRSAGQEADD